MQRSSYRWQVLRRWVIAHSDGICGICRRPVDRTLPGTHRDGPSVDHIIPLDQGGDEWHRANLRLTHLHCNSSEGAKLAHKPKGTTRRW